MNKPVGSLTQGKSCFTFFFVRFSAKFKRLLYLLGFGLRYLKQCTQSHTRLIRTHVRRKSRILRRALFLHNIAASGREWKRSLFLVCAYV